MAPLCDVVCVSPGLYEKSQQLLSLVVCNVLKSVKYKCAMGMTTTQPTSVCASVRHPLDLFIVLSTPSVCGGSMDPFTLVDKRVWDS
ncbi:hypothetical protein KIPB_001710 [Kipferlia bialata]|uniref:Uncharacterized protein n=1 Tax=Kipferlia bialata TaxID=797122 RepID=A0A9K3CPC6_9EUKA|nr:hypothetical protein KIPB_001710 [Kipferlia bialata]|eukprot:g1710.t1